MPAINSLAIAAIIRAEPQEDAPLNVGDHFAKTYIMAAL